MSRFTSELKVELASVKNKKLTLLEDLIWEINEIGSGEYITVPAGFQSDGITVPRLLWFVIPPVGHPAVRAAVLHDYLMDMWKSNILYNNVSSKKEIDHQFYLALRACKIKKTLAWLFWKGVRLYSLIRYKQ